MNPSTPPPPVPAATVAKNRSKVSLYLTPERAAALSYFMSKNPSATTMQEAIYQVIDWWALDARLTPPAIENEELADIRRLMTRSVAHQESMTERTTRALEQLAKALTGPANPLYTAVHPAPDISKKKPTATGSHLSAHKTLGAWLLDVLTRVSAPQATKVLALLKHLPSTNTQGTQYLVAELKAVEGAELSSPFESAIDVQAFNHPVGATPIYLVCQKADSHTWCAQLRVSDANRKAGRVVYEQEIRS